MDDLPPRYPDPEDYPDPLHRGRRMDERRLRDEQFADDALARGHPWIRVPRAGFRLLWPLKEGDE